MSEELDKFLEHHGVKGMHWGRRKKEKAPLNQPLSKETIRRNEYKKNLSEGKQAKKAGQELTKPQAKALRDHKRTVDGNISKYTTAAILLGYGAYSYSRVLGPSPSFKSSPNPMKTKAKMKYSDIHNGAYKVTNVR